MFLLQKIIGLLITRAFANDDFEIKQYCDSLGGLCGSGDKFLGQLLGRIVLIIFQLIGGTAVIAVIVGRLKMIIQGEQGKEEGKKIIMFGLIGFMFAVVAVVLTRFVCEFAALIFMEDKLEMCNIT